MWYNFIMKNIYEMDSRITTYECDNKKILKASGVLKEMQEAARLQMEKDGPSYDDLVSRGMALMLIRMDAEIPSEIKLNDRVKVSTWPSVNSHATFFRNYLIKMGDTVLAKGASQWALVDLKERKVLRADFPDFESYKEGEHFDLFPEKLRLRDSANYELIGRREIKYSDLDYNGHVNNTYYPDFLSDLVPELAENYRISSFRLHYVKEASLGDVLDIYSAKVSDNQLVFKAIKQNGDLNLIAEMNMVEI